jgi:hypothetical protein
MAGMLHKHKKPGHCPSPGGHSGTLGIMTVNGFQKGEDGGGPAECDGKYHSDKDLIRCQRGGTQVGAGATSRSASRADKTGVLWRP